MSPAVLTLLGGVLVALIGFAGVALTAAATRSANRLRQEADDKREAAEAESREQAAEIARRERDAEALRVERDRIAAYHEAVHAMHIREIKRLTAALAACREGRP